jgi:hypothetical protein
MAKDSYWFRHDSTAGRGLRMRKMAHIYGHWGKGVYWDVIEILRDQSNYSFNSDDSSLQLLSDLIGCKDDVKFISWFRDCIRLDLFKMESENFYSEVLCENMERWEKSKDDGSKGGNPNFKKGEPNPYYKAKDNLKDKGKDNNINKGNDKHKSIVYNIIEDKKNKKISFEQSPFFDKIKFKQSLPEWSNDKLKYYYESLLAWSNEGNKKIDWISTAKTWATRDEKEGKIKFKEEPKVETLDERALRLAGR